MAEANFEDFGDAAPALHAGQTQRLINLVGGATSVALILGLAVWGYRLAVRDVNGIPVIHAMEGPMRMAPDDPGGQIADNLGLTVNHVAADALGQTPSDNLVLAPRPVTLSPQDVAPNARVAAAPVAAPAAPVAPAPMAAPALLAAPAPQAAPAPLPAAAPAAVPAPTGAAETSASMAAPAPAPAVPAPVVAVSAPVHGAPMTSPRPMSRPKTPAAQPAAATAVATTAATALAPKPTATAAPSKPAAATPPKANAAPPPKPTAAAAPKAPAKAPPVPESVDPATIVAGTRLVQLGAFDSPDVAASSWALLQARFGDLLVDKSRVVQKATSGGRDFYRLRAYGFKDDAEARRFCAALDAANAPCVPVLVR